MSTDERDTAVPAGSQREPAVRRTRSATDGQRERKRVRDARYNQSEKGRARHRRYNHSEKGTERYSRYHEGEVGREHRVTEHFARIRASIDRLGGSTEGLTEHVPDYNAARKREALLKRLRELGWDWQRSPRPNVAYEMAPTGPDAAPREVGDQLIAEWQTLDPEQFTRRTRS